MMRKLIFCVFLIATNMLVMAQRHGGNGSPGRPPGNGNISQPPGGPNVIMYRDMKYSGMSRAFNQGSFNSQSLGFLGNNVSSIYLPPGTILTVYDNRGGARTFNTSVSNLAQYGWDNKIVSGVIRMGPGGGPGNGGSHGGNGHPRPPLPPPPPQNGIAILYKDPGFRGGAVKCGLGRLPHLGIGADRSISSIHLARGFAIRVYSGILFSGHFRTFHTSVIQLSQYGWDDMIRSVEVIRL